MSTTCPICRQQSSTLALYNQNAEEMEVEGAAGAAVANAAAEDDFQPMMEESDFEYGEDEEEEEEDDYDDYNDSDPDIDSEDEQGYDHNVIEPNALENDPIAAPIAAVEPNADVTVVLEENEDGDIVEVIYIN